MEKDKKRKTLLSVQVETPGKKLNQVYVNKRISY